MGLSSLFTFACINLPPTMTRFSTTKFRLPWLNSPDSDFIKVLILIMAICILSLTSCSANWHLSRAIAKDPSIVQPPEVEIVDTTIVIEEIRAETTFVALPMDTITIEKERLRIQIKRIHDTLVVDGMCMTDTIRIVEEVELPPVIQYKPRPTWQTILAWLLAGLFAFKIVQRAIDRFLGA
jgi:hypothetical protein